MSIEKNIYSGRDVMGSRLKSSLYNHFVEKGNKILGYNFLYRTIIQLPLEGSPLLGCLSNQASISAPLGSSEAAKERLGSLPNE